MARCKKSLPLCVTPVDEFEIITRYFRPLAAGFSGAKALADDAAFLSPPSGMDWVITTDTLAAGVHFFADDPPECIAQKALRVNLSDLAAKGAAPFCYFLALALPGGTDESWLAAFVRGLAEDQQRYGIVLAGGDTTRSPGALILTITAMGIAPHGEAALRSGARPGDALFVTGTIGDAALGLHIRQGRHTHLPEALHAPVLERYALPQPRTDFATDLRARATAAMDISDGLFQDTAHLLNTSQVGAEITLDQVPLSDAMRWLKATDKEAFLTLLGGGDDYELLFTAPADQVFTNATKIGLITQEPGLRVCDAKGRAMEIPSLGYKHRF